MTITPCIKVCSIDEMTRVCKGCGRSMEEIANWSKYTEEEKYVIMARIRPCGELTKLEKLRRYEKG